MGKLKGELILLINGLRMSFRVLRRNKLASAISILSLVLSLLFSIVIFNYVKIEQDYDTSIPSAEYKYRMNFDIYGESGRNVHSATSPAPFAPFFQSQNPEIKSFVRINSRENVLLSNPGTRSTKLQRIGWCDENVIDFLGVNMLQGNPIINDLNSLLISQSTANELFGSTSDVLGKTLRYNGSKNMVVQGVYQDFPENSSIKLDAIGALDVLQELIPDFYQDGMNWGGYSFYTYYEFNENTDLDKLISSFRAQYYERFDIKADDLPNEYFDFGLIHVRDIHLHSDADGEMVPSSSILQVQVLRFLAIIIAIIGWINFINIQSSRIPERLKEIMVRRSLGADIYSLRIMFFTEYFFICALSVAMSFLLATFIAPAFSYQSFGLSLPYFRLEASSTFIIILGSFISALYPSIMASREIQNQVVLGAKKGWSNDVMIGFQFATSLFLIVLTLTIDRQVSYMVSLDPGFDTKSLLVIDGPITSFDDDQLRAERFKRVLANSTGVEAATFSTLAPGKNKGWEGNLRSINGDSSVFQRVNLVNIFPEFFSVIDMEVLAGNIPSGPQFPEQIPRVILTKKTAEGYNWTPAEAIGKKVGYSSGAVVVAVVSDIKTVGFQQSLAPMVFIYDHVFFQHTTNDFFLAKVNGPNIFEQLKNLEESYYSIFPENNFSYHFSNELFEEQYQSERNFKQLILTFSFLAIVLSLTGLTGITIYHAALRRKEIGVRKVLGSSLTSLLILMVRRYLLVVLISGLFVLPIAFYYVEYWLSSFASRADNSPVLLLIPLCSLLVLVTLLVMLTSLNVARLNPVTVLRDE
ncbi:ABC transporter permease [Roseivirga sp. 4D4]|uniref:ABC transporter permease n=1 Tax=Roseivirga sp. 4D4 TaxID=1889784 RepID=UPI00147A8DB5|nr:FtsX-like permease family protein [Roseivirga sp. 4D4]